MKTKTVTTLAHVDVLLITVNKHETQAVLQAFEEATGNKATNVSRESRVYHDLGTINGARVFHTLSEMGSGGPGAMQQTVDKAIRALDPGAVIAIGIAFGINEKKQSIGDILISQQLRLYDLQRVGKKIVLRGDRPHASPRLVNYFDSVAQSSWQEKPKVHVGLILSGEKLVDDLDYRKQLVALECESVGGEMEGAGLYVSSAEHKVDWIVIKAICDWADGNKSKNKTARQKKAAKHAVDFLVHAMQQVPLVYEIGTADKEDGRQRRDRCVTPQSFSGLGRQEFEHVATLLLLRVLGAGTAGLRPLTEGAHSDYFVGEAVNAPATERWTGTWQIETKFYIGKDDPGKWLQKEVSTQMKRSLTRQWPDNYIILTNIEPDGPLRTSVYDQCRELVQKQNKKLAERFDIWGGKRILELLRTNPLVAKHFAYLLLPKCGLTAFTRPTRRIVTNLVMNGLAEHSRTKLEEAGDASDDSAGVHLLFTDIPFRAPPRESTRLVLANMVRASANVHQPSGLNPSSKDWLMWQKQPERARIWFLKGGPGQGKSTCSQYYCQVQRAALLLSAKHNAPQRIVDLANAILSISTLSDAPPRTLFDVRADEHAI